MIRTDDSSRPALTTAGRRAILMLANKKRKLQISPGLVLPSAFPDNCKLTIARKYVCLSDFFIGGHGPLFYFFSAIFFAVCSALECGRDRGLNRKEDCGENHKEDRGDFGPCGCNLQAGSGRSRFAPRCAPGAGNGFEWHSATGLADRRPRSRLPHGNLRHGLIGKDQRVAFRARPRHSTRRSLRAGGCKRCLRSGVSSGRRDGDEPFAVGAMRRQISIA